MEGVQGHVAYPHKADNPIPKLVRLLDRLSAARLDDGNDASAGKLDHGNDLFEPSTLAVTSVDVGNPAGNVIPARAAAQVQYQVQHRTQPAVA